MSNMRKVDPEVVNAQGREVVLLHESPHHQSLVRTNRFLLMLVFALMTFVFVLGFLVLPNYDLVDQLKNRQASYPAAAYAVQNPALSHEINALKSQLVGLVSGSIESKLRILEESIKIGSLSASLGTIQDLKNDVKVLRSYSEPPIKERDRQVNEKLIAELSHLKNLIYLTFASCGLMIAAIAGFWLRNRFRLPHQRVKSYIGRK